MLPPDFVITSTLKVGVVYKIEAPELIQTEEPHYFTVVAIAESDNFLVLSTTQLHKKINYLQKKGYDLDTLAHITPTENNGLTQDSYFNCNEYYTLTKDELIDKVKENKLNIAGTFNKEEYSTLVNSITLSEVNDIPKFLLKYDTI
ncbi:hypothetical protein [uncultured Tenacibaculum sp.]|uniref:hypothetical protein n=1 Tax=uncultured Tenacibaculum sp. TaxID=174713 RepID=UPI002607FF74|nr:hypothetical protein [uncultured Tenacibaculum sp.]